MMAEAAAVRITHERAWLVGAGVLASALTLLGSHFRDTPLVTPDEIGYLGIARYFTEAIGPSLEGTPYYHFGTSLLWAPASALAEAPASVYRIAVAMTAAMVGATPVLLVRIARELALPASPLLVAVAVVVSLWPSHFVHSHLAWSETPFRIVFLAAILAALVAGRTGRAGPALAVAALAVLAFAVHPRALAMLPLAVVFLAALACVGRLRWSVAAAAALVIVTGYASVGAVNDHLGTALWGTGVSDGERLAAFWNRVASLDGAWRFALRVLGHAWYQLSASLGLVGIGAAAAIGAFRFDRDAGRRCALAFAGAAMLGVAAASAAQLVDARRLDHVVYGRYLDGVTIILLWLGARSLFSVEEQRVKRWVALASAGIILAAGALLHDLYADASLKPLGNANTAGIYPLLLAASRLLPDPPLALFLGVSAGAAAAVAVLAVVRGRAPVTLLVLAVYVGAGDVVITRAMWHATVRERARLAAAAQVYDAAGDADIHADRSARGRDTLIDQYMLHTRPYLWVSVRDDVLADGAFVLLRPPAQNAVVGACVGRFDDGRLLYRNGTPGPACRAP
jgi:hypothetical protein